MEHFREIDRKIEAHLIAKASLGGSETLTQLLIDLPLQFRFGIVVGFIEELKL